MIFPIGDTQVKGGHKPLFTYTFLVLNILIFALQVSQPGNLICEFAVMPENIKNGSHLYTLLTSLFMHGSYMHIIGNLLFLWVFADNIEAVIGNFRFLIFYLGGGVIASLAHIYLGTPAADTLPCCMPCDGCEGPVMCAGFIPSLGASGAISAVMGAYILLFPSSKIKVLVLIFFTSIYVSAWVFLGLWFVQQLFAGIGSTSALAQQAESGVAWWAHIGGFVFGVAVAWIYKNKRGSNPVIHSDEDRNYL